MPNSELPYGIETKEQLQESTIFPVELARKYKGGPFLKIWGHLEGFKRLSRSEFKYLVKYGVVKSFKLSEEEVVSILKRKHAQKLKEKPMELVDVCDWCKGETYTLHKHHYPVPKKKGGKDVVGVCPNCHYEFHVLTEGVHYKITEEIEEAFIRCSQKKQDLLKKFEIAERD